MSTITTLYFGGELRRLRARRRPHHQVLDDAGHLGGGHLLDEVAVGLARCRDPLVVREAPARVHEGEPRLRFRPVAGRAAHGVEDRGLVPALAVLQPVEMKIGRARRAGLGGGAQGLAGHDARPDLEPREDDGRGPVAEGADGGPRVDAEVVFAASVLEPPVREFPAHAHPEADLAADEVFAALGADRVRRGVEKAAQVREEPDGDDDDARIRLRGQDLAIQESGVGSIAAAGEAMGKGLRHRGRVFRRDRLPRVLRVADLDAALVADRDVGTSVPRIDRVHARPHVFVAGRDAHGQDLRLAEVGHGVEYGQRADVVDVARHVGVEDDLDGRAGGEARARGQTENRDREGGARREREWFHDTSADTLLVLERVRG